MIVVRRAQERCCQRRDGQELWSTFPVNDELGLLAEGFGTLEDVTEAWLPPASGVWRHVPHEAEIITYVHDGAIAYEDSTGRSGVIHAGEFQHLTAGRRVRHGNANVSQVDRAHVFRLRFQPVVVGLELSRDQRRFSAAERRGTLRVVASPDGQRGSLRVHQNVLVFSALLEPGHHVVHALAPGRIVWVHVVQGEATMGDLILTAGDGVGATHERAVALTAREPTELLLVDLDHRIKTTRRSRPPSDVRKDNHEDPTPVP